MISFDVLRGSRCAGTTSVTRSLLILPSLASLRLSDPEPRSYLTETVAPYNHPDHGIRRLMATTITIVEA